MNNLIEIINYDLKVNLEDIIKLNDITKEYNLILSKEQIISLINTKNNTLKEIGRIEFNNTIIKDIISNFYDSPYIDEDNYFNTIEELINIFYIYRNNFNLSDDQIIKYMKLRFNNYSNGSLELLLGNDLEYLENNLKEIINEL